MNKEFLQGKKNLTDAVEAGYEVWALGYDRNDNATDFEVKIADFTTEDAAIQSAMDNANAESFRNLMIARHSAIPYNVQSIEIRVEETEETAPDYFENIDTVFTSELFKI